MFRPANPASANGSLIGSVRRMTSAVSHYVRARTKLFLHEAGQARRHVVQIAVLGLIVAAGFGLGYVALVAALTAWMARAWWDGQWAPALAVTGGIHLLTALACALVAQRLWKKHGFFPATLREFKEDQKWLRTNESTK